MIIPPEIKETEQGVSIRYLEPHLCFEGKCGSLTQILFSIIDEIRLFEIILIIIAILILAFEIIELFKYRLLAKK